ncbi:MAG: thioredoxin [Dehalococcoidia bacterium]
MATWVEELYEDTFDGTLEEHDLLFVDFYADWCGPCKAVAPVVERVAREYAGRVAFGKLNTEGNPLIARRYGIRSIPTMMVFARGKPVSRAGGFQPETRIRAMLDPHAPPPPAEPPPPARSGGLLSRLLGR